MPTGEKMMPQIKLTLDSLLVISKIKPILVPKFYLIELNF